MPSKNIDRETWQEFFDDFSEEHEGRNSDIEMYEKGSSERVAIARDLPFSGISLDGETDVVSVSAGRDRGDHLSHRVPFTEKVNVEILDGNNLVSLRLESRDGTKTLLRLK